MFVCKEVKVEEGGQSEGQVLDGETVITISFLSIIN